MRYLVRTYPALIPLISPSYQVPSRFLFLLYGIAEVSRTYSYSSLIGHLYQSIKEMRLNTLKGGKCGGPSLQALPTEASRVGGESEGARGPETISLFPPHTPAPEGGQRAGILPSLGEAL
jgi:hypothetical protein